MADITQIRNMYLMLGTSCNMTCRHCSQIPVKGKKVQKQECSVAVLNFIKQWDNELDLKHYGFGEVNPCYI